MKSTPEILDDHVIYGSWDDTYGNQVLVYNHPNGKDSHVFVMDGADYGGGIVRHGILSTAVVNAIYEKSDNDYEFHRAMRIALDEQ